MKCFIIAEAGVNHNGSLEQALKLVDVAAVAGADAVKFQTFRPEELVSAAAPKAAYQEAATGPGESQLDMIRALALSPEQHALIQAHCRKRGIDFLSTPFDAASAAFLVRDLGMNLIKIPSGELTNAPLLLRLAQFGLPMILSTGMSSLEEVRMALGALAFGLLGLKTPPSPGAFLKAGSSAAGKKRLAEKLSLLHCTSEYPAPFAEVNLRAMDILAKAFGLPVGLSDHTLGIAVPIAAAARGARIIEKHFTLDRTQPGPDHPASLEPAELAAMIAGIRQVEQALGSGEKQPAPSEIKNRAVARRSLVALRPVRAGELWTEENLACKRPGRGISPLRFWDYLGRPALREYAADELLQE